MALLFSEGFEFYGNATADKSSLLARLAAYDNLNTVRMILSGSNSQRYFNLSNYTLDTLISAQLSIPTASDLYLCFSFYIPSLDQVNKTSGSNFATFYSNGSTSYPQVSIKLTSSFQLQWAVGDATNITFLNTDRLVTPYSWHSIVIHIKVSGLAGIVEVVLDGTLLASITNVNTNVQGTGEISLIRLYQPWTNYSIDNLVVYDSSGDSLWNGFLPGVHPIIVGLQPGGEAVSSGVDNTLALLLRMEGADGSTTFTDESNNVLTVVPIGDVKISTQYWKYGASSAYFDGSGDCLSVNGTVLDFVSSDFSLELYFYPQSYGKNNGDGYYSTLLSKQDNNGSSWYLRFYGQNSYDQLVFAFTQNGTDFTTITANAPNIKKSLWNHVAVARANSSLGLFLNGLCVGTATITGSISSALNTPVIVGAAKLNATTTSEFTGFIDSLRVLNGRAAYTGTLNSTYTLPLPFPAASNNWSGSVSVLNKDAFDDTTYVTATINQAKWFFTLFFGAQSLTDFNATNPYRRIYDISTYNRYGCGENWILFYDSIKSISTGFIITKTPIFRVCGWNHSINSFAKAPDASDWSIAKLADLLVGIGRD